MRAERSGVRRVLDALPPALAAAVGAAVALPAVRWEPLHYDEAITLELAAQPLDEIVHSVFVERGGSLLYFFVEHFALDWIGGLEGLRLPNVVCFALAVVAAWALGRTLLGPLEGALLAAVLALAPLAVSLATFGRMYAPFLLLVLVAALLAERAGRLGGRGRWALAGAGAGLLVHVHPIAPLYVAVPIVAAWAVSPAPFRATARAAWPAAVAAVAVAAPYLYALGVLRSRYGVRPSTDLLDTTAGRSVPEEAFRALAPGGGAAALALAFAAAAGLVWASRERPRLALLLGTWVALPIVFFTLVPAENARFYGRYLLPALPAYLLLAVLGCLALGTLARRRALVGGAVVAALAGAEAVDAGQRLDRLRALGLPAASIAVRAGDVLFASSGTPIADRPPELLDRYVVLARDDVLHVDELPAVDPRFAENVVRDGVERVRSFVRDSSGDRHGAWILRGPDRRVTLALMRLARNPLVAPTRISPTLVVVRTTGPFRARQLVELGVRVRQAWSIRSPSDRWVQTLIVIDRRALARSP